MKIIDFEKKGNLVRFYLGDGDDYWGDDWGDRPYEHNAGSVYERYIKGYKEIVFPFGVLVLEPCDGECNSRYSKEDMKKRKVPCILVVPEERAAEKFYSENFREWVDGLDVKRIYFDDDESVLAK